MSVKSIPIRYVLVSLLLVMQFSGVHLHVDAQGQDHGVHRTHVHESEPVPSGHGHGHGHDDEIDISLLEWGNASNKPAWFLAVLPILFVATGAPNRQRLKPRQQMFRVLRSSRWRPPLRAPPAFR